MWQRLTQQSWLRSFLVIMMVLTAIPAPTYGAISLAQGTPSLPPDSDLDGLLDQVEAAGWCNTVGCFQTEALDADSDDDGLTDGEEKLFETNPNDSTNPGLSVVYEDAFETGEYKFAWTPRVRVGEFRPFGQEMIGTETIVIRRGTTFTVNGPGSVGGYQVTLQDGDAINDKSPLPSSGSPLTPLIIGGRIACGDRCNGWTVAIPSNSTVGKYKLVASNGHGWTDELIVDVIFEMPTGLTEAQIDGFLYDGDRENDKDTTAVWFYGKNDEVTELKIRLYGYYYLLSQYSSYIFDGEEAVRYYGKTPEDYANAIQAIHGTDNTWDASEELTERVDEVTCFAYPLTPRTSSWDTLFPSASNLNNQCSNIAGLVTALHRSVGIPSRLVAVDHRNSNFDTSSEVWTRSSSSVSYKWYTTRGWNANEGTTDYPNPEEKYCSTTRVAKGIRVRRSRSSYGSTYYRPFRMVWPSRGSASNGNEYMLLTSNENWVWSQVGGGADYYWVTWDKYNVSRYNWLETAAMAYWNNDYQVGHEPVDVANPPAKPPAWNDPTPPDWLPPAAPPTLNSISNGDGDGDYDVTWSNVPYTSYRLQEDDNPSFSSSETVYSGNNLDYAVIDQSVGSWYYRVRADNDFGVSDWSNVESTTVDPSPPLAGLEGGAVPQDTSSLLATTTVTTETEALAGKVYLGEILGEYGVDEDGDGQFDYLVLEAGVEVVQPGSYWILAQLGSDHPDVALSGGVMAADTFQVDLEAGQQVVDLVFGAYSISRTRVDGPYKLMYFLITDVDDPDPVAFANDALDYKNNSYTTAAYKFNDFDTPAAMFARQYTDRGIDSNRDGFLEALEVDVSLDIYQPGTYTVVGELYDSHNKLVGEATWTGPGPLATLRFDDLSRTFGGPYELRNLRLADSDGDLEQIERAYTTQQVSHGQPVSGFVATALDTGGVDLRALGMMETYNQVGVDTNGNGKYDFLEIRVGVQIVDDPGNYQLEGWLADEQGNLVSWAHTGPVPLSIGTHELTLAYDGRALADHMKEHSQGAQRFTLVALKLYSGTLEWDSISDEVDVAFTTDNYTRNRFELPARAVAFEDLMENGEGQWSAGYEPWAIVQNGNYVSADHAWYAANTSATLDAVVDLSDVLPRKLRFRTYHRLGVSGATGYVKVSSNGSDWTILTTLSDNLGSWQTKVLNLSGFDNKTSLYLRFELDSAGGASDDRWYVDDVLVVGILNDTDGDGMPDGWEADNGLDPGGFDAGGDPDGDGLTNLDEYLNSTDPQDPDTDGDEMPDGWEVENGFDPLTDDAGGDFDGDGLTNFGEYQNDTDPLDPDSDDDGLTDGQEVNTYSTDPNDVDSDNDGLMDGEEVKTHKTNPNDADSDDDEMPDGWEVDNDLAPLDDNDNGSTGPNDDPDEDGLSNLEEYLAHTDPHNPDTDGDGIPDGIDPTPAGATYLPIIIK